MQPLTRNALIVLGIVAAAFSIGRFDGHRAGVQDASAQQYRVLRDTILDSIRVVEQHVRVDTVRVRQADAKAMTARASFDSAAAVVEAVADTASVVPTSLVMPEIQACKDMRDADLQQIDMMKVVQRDLVAEVELEQRRANLAEQQLAKQHTRFGFRTGAIAGASVVLAVLHFAR